MKRRKMKSQERDSSSSGEKNLQKTELEMFSNYSDLEDSSDSEVEITSSSPSVTIVTAESSSEESSSETDSEEEKLRDDGEKVALILNYLQKVTPEIARELQVRLMEKNYLF